ncbi:hypothetical protein BT93_H0861 [Corymbia citriodora subsp. variegata]|nr:hypothetical protein BT93_H0861 [Corymbia citriodora subsp. variegata]
MMDGISGKIDQNIYRLAYQEEHGHKGMTNPTGSNWFFPLHLDMDWAFSMTGGRSDLPRSSIQQPSPDRVGHNETPMGRRLAPPWS